MLRSQRRLTRSEHEALGALPEEGERKNAQIPRSSDWLDMVLFTVALWQYNKAALNWATANGKLTPEEIAQ